MASVLVGALFMMCYIRMMARRNVEEELTDLLRIPTDEEDYTETDDMILFSYSYHSYEPDIFDIDYQPERFLI